MKQVCLSMIVKNEAHVVYNCLKNISKYIDYYIIVDTGSDDNTIDEINRFSKDYNLEGEIYKHKFDDEYFDFSKNRNYCLDKCRGKSEYILVFDADDIIEGEILNYRSLLDPSSVLKLRFKHSIQYYRPVIFPNDSSIKYKLPLHEYLYVDNYRFNIKYVDQGGYNLKSRRLGDRNKNPDKYLHDGLCLKKAIENSTPHSEGYDRLNFYCGQSFALTTSHLEEAKKYYWKSYEYSFWNQQKYYSLYGIMLINNKTSKDPKLGLNLFQLSEKIGLEREELRYSYIYNYNPSKSNIIDTFIERNVKKNLDTKSFLFYNETINENMFKYYINFVLDNHTEIFRRCSSDNPIINDISFYCNYMMKDNSYTDGYYIMSDLIDYYGRKLNNFFEIEKIRDQYVDRIMKITSKPYTLTLESKEYKDKVLVSLTSCRRYDLMYPTLNSFFNCCKDVNLVHTFLCIDDNSSEEDRDKMKKDFPMFKFIFKGESDKGHPISMNMIYDYANDNNFDYIFHMEDDWQFVQNRNYIMDCINVLNSDSNYIQCIPNRNNMEIPNYLRKVGRGKYIHNDDGYHHILHEHFDNPSLNLNSRDISFRNQSNISYWGSFTFHTGMWKFENVKKIGHFSTDGFFEKDYAIDCLNSGFQLTFLDTFSYYNIGRKSWEKNSSNAYTMNSISQFKSDNDIQIYVQTNKDNFENNWKLFKDRHYKDYKFKGYYDNNIDIFLQLNDSMRILIPSNYYINDDLIKYCHNLELNNESIYLSDTGILICKGKTESTKKVDYPYHLLNVPFESPDYSIPGFDFYPHQDLIGYDLDHIKYRSDDTPLNPSERKIFLNTCIQRCVTLNCDVFNTFGYIKVLPENNYTLNKVKWFSKGYHGVYIKKKND